MDAIAHQPINATPTAALVQQLLHSPGLPVYVQRFQSLLQAEREKRERFYEEMSEQQKVEFINGEVVVQTPAKRIFSIFRGKVRF
jgi:hypothetical protein